MIKALFINFKSVSRLGVSPLLYQNDYQHFKNNKQNGSRYSPSLIFNSFSSKIKQI